MSVKPNYKFYRACYRLANPFVRFFRPFEVLGSENISAGAAMVCANHSAMIDPFMIALALGIGSHVHVMAKIELFKIPVISQILSKLGMIRVNRDVLDGASIKSTLGYLKMGDKVVVFPEGTRASVYDEGAVKSGAVKIAERAGVPIVPVFIPRRKPFFRKSKLIIGEPYYIEKQREKRTAEDYARISKDLMRRIHALGENSDAALKE
jgi:1-acyl-sn-glycerol-3-phosphate acyltransferase